MTRRFHGFMCHTGEEPGTETNARTNDPDKTKETQPTPLAVMQLQRAEIARLIDVLQMEVDRLAERLEADPSNWALTGNVSIIRHDLIGVVAFASSMDRADVVRFLSEEA